MDKTDNPLQQLLAVVGSSAAIATLIGFLTGEEGQRLKDRRMVPDRLLAEAPATIAALLGIVENTFPGMVRKGAIEDFEVALLARDGARCLSLLQGMIIESPTEGVGAATKEETHDQD
jgi:hypothetical protein